MHFDGTRLEELKKAANNSDSGSAGGPDGVGYYFYKISLNLLLNCFTEMVTVHHKLIEPYNSVKLLIIPKKGDISHKKKFRGIFLCFTGMATKYL